MSKLSSLDLSFNHFDDEGCLALIKRLEAMKYLRFLDLHCNNISDASGEALAMLVKANRKLNYINVS